MRLVVAKVFWVLVLSAYAAPSPLRTPMLNGCGGGLQYCCRSVYSYRRIVATLWLENGSIFRRIPGNEPFLSSAESSLQCAVELVGSVTKWSTSLILYCKCPGEQYLSWFIIFMHYFFNLIQFNQILPKLTKLLK